MVNIEKLPIPPQSLGEGPHWDQATQTLILININDGTGFKYNPATKKCTTVDFGFKPVSFILPIEGKKDEYIVSGKLDIRRVVWDGESPKPSKVEILSKIEAQEDEDRINDGKCDPRGRIWAGTMGPYIEKENTFIEGKGAFYSYETGKGFVKHLSGIGLSNGLAWKKDGAKLYYIDSLTRQVAEYSFDIEKGTVGERKVILDLEANSIPGFPDGMTIDAEDKLWLAVFGGSRVVRIDPDSGKVLQTINLPSYQITSVAFGGKDLDELYVTSAVFDNLPQEIRDQYPDSGCTFRITGLNVRGLPMINFKE